MKTKLLIQGLLAAGLAVPTLASAINFTGIVYVQYGDAISYSLPVAGLQSTGQLPKPGDEFYVASSPGAISDLIIVATGTGGKPMTENVLNSDNSYETPNGVNVKTSDSYFNPSADLTANNTTDGNYRGTQGTVANNGNDTWDISLASLQNFLQGGDMVFYMNNNNVNRGAASLQSLAAWARVWITDASGNRVGVTGDGSGSSAANQSGYFYLSNMGGQYDTVSQGGGGNFLGSVANFTGSGANPGANTATGTNPATGLPGMTTDYVLSGGQICIIYATPPGFSSPVPVPVACGTPGASAPINHNLGANQAAYAIMFPELNGLMAGLFGAGGDLSGYSLHLDVRLGCNAYTQLNSKGDPLTNSIACGTYNGWGTSLNNGYEQIFIASTTRQPPNVPEPGVLGLMGLGLFGLAAMRRRKGQA